MKKILLAVAAVGLAFGANAQQWDELFEASFEGKVIHDGDEVWITQYDDYSEMGMGYDYQAQHIELKNLQDAPRQCFAAMTFTDQPTQSMLQADEAYWGKPALCYTGGVIMGGKPTNACLSGSGVMIGAGFAGVPAKGTDSFQWQPHLSFCSPEAVSKYKILLQPMEGEGDDAVDYGTGLTFYVVFAAKDLSGVAEIEAAEEGDAIYYDLAGRVVENPVKGLYIKVAGGKAIKVMK